MTYAIVVRKPPSVSLGYAAALLTTLIWGSSFVATRLLLGELAPLSVQALRFLFGSLAYLALLAVASRGWPKRPRRP
jgi:drug/metabolite transporter (DMT)-like permease